MTLGTGPTARSIAAGYLTLMVGLPIAALVALAFRGGPAEFLRGISRPEAVSALWLTIGMSTLATSVSLIAGFGVAWMLTRDRIFGRRLLDAAIDLPLAVPAVVTGLLLVGVYGPNGALGRELERYGVHILFARPGIVLAMLTVTLPLVVRSLQPSIEALDRDVEAAARSLGAGSRAAFWRVVVPALRPALLTAGTLAFARCLGEFGSLVLIAGNAPFRTQVASVYVYGRVESGAPTEAAAVAVAMLLGSVALLLAVEAVQVARSRRKGGVA